jgi:hypothetical protein
LRLRGIFPLVLVGKQVGNRNGKRTLPLILACVLPLFLAACGGGSKSGPPPANAVVRGAGFQFEVPPGWRTSRTGTSVVVRQDAAGETLVSATAFALLKPYSPKLFARAAQELDGVAAKLAAQAHSTIAESQTVTVGGERVRSYRLTVKPTSGAPFDEQIGFVLHGKREIQLLCRAPVGANDPDGACALLYATFRLRS